ncbi:MAG TPA: hypothetical protein VFH73_27410, partial [Polyangia bacterium]|nr:hypothetical protein [Polyangia bacterium]
MRMACVFVPQLALASVLRRNPDGRDGAIALLSADGAKPRVTEMTDQARRAGVRRGMTAAQAEAASPTLRLVTATTADIEAAAAALADVGFSFAPRIDDSEPGRVFFQVGDLDRLYPEGEAAIVQAIAARAAHVGLGVRVAIASSKVVARIATRARTLAVVGAGVASARAFLAPLPIAVLLGNDPQDSDNASVKDPVLVALRRWGIATAGALAALPAAEVALRLGEIGARLCRRAAGSEEEPFVPHLPADALEEAIELEYAVAELEPLSFVLRGLMDRALTRLACRSLACAGLTLRLQLDPRGLDVREIPIAAPTRESATLLQLARLDLTRRPPASPVTGVRLIALPARARTAQLDFLRPTGPAPDRLAATIARLAALVGPDNVGVPHAEDTWREEAVTVKPYTDRTGPPPAAPADRTQPTSNALTLRRFRPA